MTRGDDVEDVLRTYVSEWMTEEELEPFIHIGATKIRVYLEQLAADGIVERRDRVLLRMQDRVGENSRAVKRRVVEFRVTS